MQKLLSILSCISIVTACKSTRTSTGVNQETTDFTIAFGSCNKPELDNTLWDDVVKSKPDVWVWGGDIVYADTDNMTELKGHYNAQNEVEGYKKVKHTMPIIGTWDDHDYGLNDGGVEFTAKKESQKEFLDFMGLSEDDPRRKREGVYAVHDYVLESGSVRIFVLDTRYFRTALTPDNDTEKRTKPNKYGEGTVLGGQQWQWLERELLASKADFNVLISSVQFLSNEHGFECWGNFPHEVDRLKKTITDSKAKGVIVLSGDRHISEFSSVEVEGLTYPLIDFTSSGLTHVYSNFTEEYNSFRVGKVVSTLSFGVVKLNFKKKQANFQMIGDSSKILGELQQQY